MRGQKGFALVIALIVTTLLVALLAEFVNEVYVDTSHSHNFVASQQAGVLAESGIAGGIKLLQVSSMLRTGGEAYSSLLEPWAQPQSFDTENGTVSISIEEETGKLNLNTATSANGTSNAYTQMALRLLNRLKLSKLSTDLTDALLDWVDENDAPLPGGAETTYYSTLKPPYAAKNKRLETVEELALVKGFTPEVLMKLRPCVTVYGNSSDAETASKINVNTAGKDVLAALDDRMSDDLVQRVLDFRKTRPIKGMADFNSIPGIDAVSPAFAANIAFIGSVYRIRAEGRVGESVAVAEAVVRNLGGTGTPIVLYWREY